MNEIVAAIRWKEPCEYSGAPHMQMDAIRLFHSLGFTTTCLSGHNLWTKLKKL